MFWLSVKWCRNSNDDTDNNDDNNNNNNNSNSRKLKQILSAVFYGLASFLITVVNKSVLTSYAFPSFQVLAIGQMLATILVLFVAKRCHIVSYASFDASTFANIFPLPLIYVGNMIFGLGGTKELSLPMFTALRRFSILLTMLLEWCLLRMRPTVSVQCSVYTMIVGAIVAASNDIAFSLHSYVFVLLNNVFTAANGVYTKQKLEARELGKYGLMFYNALFMVVPAVMCAIYTGEIQLALEYEHWTNPMFLFQLVLSCFMGFILSYSVVLCTCYNSALTTTIVGCLKNIFVTYLGMMIGGDYIFTWLNFIGINISVCGSLIYTYVTFSGKSPSGKPVYVPLKSAELSASTARVLTV